MAWLIAPLALLIERVVGYPPAVFKLVGHPVTWMGALITWFEVRLNQGNNRRLKGTAMLFLLLGTGLAFSLLVLAITRSIPFGWVIESILASSLLAQKELGRAVKAVADGLNLSIDSGRRAVSHIVGRDPSVLDESGVAKAAIESLAESTSDGIIAPLFWLFVAGLPGIVLYKAANTADSMVGHKTERYAEFGWASARFDDLVNWIPARLSALLIAGASFVVGVDTGILHLAAAIGVPLVAIFCGSRPQLTGPLGAGPMEVLGEHGSMPTVDEVLAAVRRVAPR